MKDLSYARREAEYVLGLISDKAHGTNTQYMYRIEHYIKILETWMVEL